MIAFIGSVFSPYYAWARQRSERQPGRPDSAMEALDFCAVNVALYGPGAKRWAMTERSAAHVQRERHRLQIGRSALHWRDSALHVELDEITSPWPRRLRGNIVLHPAALPAREYALSEAGGHRWQPIAPCARAEVSLSHPDLRWTGSAYLDHNRGERPLERDFARWSWLRGTRHDGSTSVLYDAVRREAGPLSLALAFDRHGTVTPFEPPPVQPLPHTGWRIAREVRTDSRKDTHNGTLDELSAAPAQLVRTLEDTPFYARSLVRTRLQGEPVTAMLENLSLDRFAAPWVRCLLPFRMPRRR